MPAVLRYALAAAILIVLAFVVAPLVPVAALATALFWILLLLGIGCGVYAGYLLLAGRTTGYPDR